MGFNTVAMFLNDRANELTTRGDEVLADLRDCLAGGQGTDRWGGRAGMHVLPSVHADGQQVVVAGGNRITPLGICRDRSHDPETILRQLADQHGFRLVRKRAQHDPS